jgi:hypothetical protein
MGTRNYGSITPANTVDLDLTEDVVALRAASNAVLTVITYADSARTIAITTAPTPATVVVVSDRALGRYVRITSSGATRLDVIVERT